MRQLVFIVTLAAFLLSGCGSLAAPAAPSAVPLATATLATPLTADPSPTAVPTGAVAVSGASNPYAKYTIPYLRTRTYGGGQLQVIGAPIQFSNFVRYLIAYPSDGISIAGFMDVPNGLGPFPVVIMLHGYVDPLAYTTLDYTTPYADALAGEGYMVLHPNMRNFPPSGTGDDLFRVGMAIDVLNLIAIVKATGGQDGPLRAADPQRIGLWGHGMGAAIATRVMTVSPDIKAAVLYSPVSGDEQKNYATPGIWWGSKQGYPENAVPAQEMPLISPMYFYQYIEAAVSIHQGLADPLIPVRWSQATCDQLEELSKIVECHYYDSEANLFSKKGGKTLIRLSLLFFGHNLRGS